MIKIANTLRSKSAFPAVLATLVDVFGSSYRRSGARMLHTPTGCVIGSISGGCLENDLNAHAQALLQSGGSHRLVTYDTTDENDLLWGVGTGCHGVVKILLEVLPHPPAWLPAVLAVASDRKPIALQTVWASDDPTLPLGTTLAPHAPPAPASVHVFRHELLPPWHLVIFGAGDDAQPLASMAQSMEWQVTVVDPRPEKATAERFPLADQVACLPAKSAVSQLRWDDRTVAVVMTHHYVHDLPLVQQLLPLQLPFVGLLGPRQRGQKILSDARFAAAAPGAASLHAPVGLDLGGDGAQAVALSILAEIQAHLHGRDARPLRERVRPIHHDD